MHAAFPRFTQDINHIIQLGAANMPSSELTDRIGGKLLANGMAKALQAGFSLLMMESIGSTGDSRKKGKTFFDENFVIHDPNAEYESRFYQGKFLIRTRKEADDMNVLVRFCPEPEKLFFAGILNPMSVVSAEALSEEEAERVEADPARVDLVIRFKDVKSITGLMKEPEVDMVGLLLENLVQLTGNVGHLFKLGAIAANIKESIDLPL
ncbi:MAG: hypothetical protein ACE5DR_05795 [Thermodesulfobacteriota bacterium]